MNDIEIVNLQWFRGEEYMDYFRFLDSTGGFWIHRWGDHAIRTLAVAMYPPRAWTRGELSDSEMCEMAISAYVVQCLFYGSFMVLLRVAYYRAPPASEVLE